MKVVFAGTPEFAANALRTIYQAGHSIELILTQPDRPAGRGMQLQASPVKKYALEKNILCLQPESLNAQNIDTHKKSQALAALNVLSELDFDVMVVVAYGLLLPKEVLDLANDKQRFGCYNIHASLLPRWRGAAPIQRAIEAGDSKTGVAIMLMDAGLDTGDVVTSEAIEILPTDTTSSLQDRLAVLGANLIVQCLSECAKGGRPKASPQPKDGVTYAQKIKKAEGAIDWSRSAKQLDQQIRALNPSPGANTVYKGETLKIWFSQAYSPSENANLLLPGTVLGKSDAGMLVQCGNGILEVLQIQKPGGKKVAALAWLGEEQTKQKEIRFDALLANLT